MKQPKNYKVYKAVEQIIELNKGKKDSKENAVFVLAIYKKDLKAQSKVLMNGFQISEIDVILREVYGKIFEMRNRGNSKMVKINQKLSG